MLTDCTLTASDVVLEFDSRLKSDSSLYFSGLGLDSGVARNLSQGHTFEA